MKINYEPGSNIYAVIGDPVSHSSSPVLHNTLFDIYNLSGIYIPIHIRKGELDKLFAVAEGLNLKGMNCTMPHKQAVIPYCDEIDPAARLCNSVNTVIWRENGIYGTSTDAAGLRRSVEKAGYTYDGQKILFIGAGAVSRPIAYSMAQTAESITFVNRTCEAALRNAQFIMNNTGCDANCISFNTEEMKKAAENSTLVINTTCLGMNGSNADFSDLSFLDAVPEGSLVLDLIYNPLETKFLKYASKRGLPSLNGLPMLIYQGFETFSLFTGITPSEDDYRLVVKAMGLNV
jgi:shikimate dehydrogenase